MPDKYTHTLWCASSGYVRSDYFNGEFWVDAKKYCYEVTAWMPLPEPYKANTIDQIVANGELYPGEFDDPIAEEGSDKE